MSWLKKEEKFLRRHYSDYSFEKLSNSEILSDKSREAIESKARRMNLRKEYETDNWTEDELNKLYELYPFEKKEEIEEELEDKTWEEIENKADGENLIRFDGQEISLSEKSFSLQSTEIELDIEGDEMTLLPLGDIHFGHTASNLQKVKDTLERLEEDDKEFRIILMGDLWEGATVDSPNSEFDIEQTPQEQYQTILSLLNQYQDKILGCLVGNHEQFTSDITGLDKMRDLARELNIPFLKYRGLLQLNINGINYQIVAQHGSTGSRSIGGKTRALKRMNNIYPNADIYLHAHTHDKAILVDKVFEARGNSPVGKKRYYALTGSFLEFPGTYASRKDYAPSSLGTVEIRLSTEEKSIKPILS